MQTHTGHLDQNRKISLGMRRSDVLDPQHPPTPLMHDLHRGRARGSRHPTHECPHQARLPTPRHPISATQKTKTPNHSHQNLPNGHREPTQAGRRSAAVLQLIDREVEEGHGTDTSLETVTKLVLRIVRGKLRTCFGTPMVWLRLSHLESRLGNFGEFIVIRLSRARLAQFIAALSAMVRALILTSGSAQASSTNEGPFHHRRHGRARRATGLHAASMTFKSMARAVSALVTALALSVVGLAVTAVPASAHTGDLNATSVCQADGTYLVTYTLTIANTNLPGSTMWTVGNAPSVVPPTSNAGLERGPVVSQGAGPITLGTTTVPGNAKSAPWAYAYTTWTDNYQKGSDGGNIALGGTCTAPVVPVAPGTPTAAPQTCTPTETGQAFTGGSVTLPADTSSIKYTISGGKTTGLTPDSYTVTATAQGTSVLAPSTGWVLNQAKTVATYTVVIKAADGCAVNPGPKITYGDWTGTPTCENPSIYQTRDVFTAVYSWIKGEWVLGTPVKTGSETATQPTALSADQVKACHPKLPPTVEFGSQTCTVGDQGQPNLTGGQIVLGTSEGVSTKVMKDNAEVSPLTDLLPGTYEVVASLTDAGHSSWGTPPTGWTLNDDGTVSFSVTIGAADLAQCTVDQPKAVITYGDWMGAPTCDNTSIYQTRDVFTAVYSWIKGEWVLGTAVKTGSETATEPMALTADQVKACTMDLTLTKSVISDGPYYAGSVVTYQLAPRNDGPGDALAGWSVTDVLPVGMTLVSISGDGYTCDTSMVCTSSVALAADATGTPITVVAQIMEDEQPGTLKNVAYVSPAKGDVPETNPLVIPTLATDTSTSVTDNDAQAVIDVLAPQVEGIVLTLPNTGTTIPLTWLLGAVGIIAAGVILLGAARFNARGRKI